MRRKQYKRKLKASNININKVKVSPTIINRITLARTSVKKKPTKSVLSLGYINTTPNGELLDLSRRINNLEIERTKLQQKADGVAVGVSGFIQAEQQNKAEPLPPLETIYSSPQVSISKQHDKLNHPSSTFGSSNNQLSQQSGVKLEEVTNLFKQKLEEKTPTPKKNLLKEELNKQYIREEIGRRVSQRERKEPERFDPSKAGKRFTFTHKQ